MMLTNSLSAWHVSNQQYLMLALRRVQSLLEQRVDGREVTAPDETFLRELRPSMPVPPALETLCALFNLSAFERDVILLCAGIELSSRFGELCATAQGDKNRIAPTFSLALALLPDAHWSAIAPNSPLRHWHLVEVVPGSAITQSALKIDERILHYLTGIQGQDEHLNGYIHSLIAQPALAQSHETMAESIVSIWRSIPDNQSLPVVQLCGSDTGTRRAIAASACAVLGLRLAVMPVSVIPASPLDFDWLLRAWMRESMLSGSALLLEADDTESDTPQADGALIRWLEQVQAPLFIASRERRRSGARPMVTFDVQKPTFEEQRALWKEALGSAGISLNGKLDAIITNFSMNADAILSASQHALESPDNISAVLWQACLDISQPRLGDLAQGIEPVAGWDDLILPPAQMETLREIAIQVRQRLKVYETWGFSGRSKRGLGISALFAGVSGTGKTMAAEVLAKELHLSLFRIDLSQVISKYIGETEKNLRRVFDATEESSAILLFDEADALFGKRSEVKDSHDRYANIEVGYLLQRMEAYRGLAILTTNMKESLDSAFLRRIRFVMHFPFPDVQQRSEIWRKAFPLQAPVEDLAFDSLARLSVTGGSIRNIALHAAFLAADHDEPVKMSHLLRAAKVEYAKLERPLSDSEVRGWV